KKFIHDLLEKGIQLANFEVTFFTDWENRKNKQKLPIEQFISYVSRPSQKDTDTQLTTLLPIKELETVQAFKAQLFLTLNSEIYIGHENWHQATPAVAERGDVEAYATAYLANGKITHLKFNSIHHPIFTMEKIRDFVRVLNENMIDTSQVSCMIKSTEKRK